MNTQALNDMKDMLHEVEAGTWRPSKGKEGVIDLLDMVGDVTEFDVDSWGEQIVDVETMEPCGFSACAVGHACLDDRFPQLTAVCEDGVEMEVRVAGAQETQDVVHQLREVFDVDYDSVAYMFLNRPTDIPVGAEYAGLTAAEVARRVDNVLKGER